MKKIKTEVKELNKRLAYKERSYMKDEEDTDGCHGQAESTEEPASFHKKYTTQLFKPPKTSVEELPHPSSKQEKIITLLKTLSENKRMRLNLPPLQAAGAATCSTRFVGLPKPSSVKEKIMIYEEQLKMGMESEIHKEVKTRTGHLQTAKDSIKKPIRQTSYELCRQSSPLVLSLHE